MSVLVQDIVIRAGQKARQGQSEADSGIWDDNVWRLVENALHALAKEVAEDQARRHILTRSYPLPMVDGICGLSGATYADLLREYLCYARFYDPDDADAIAPYVWKAEANALRGYLSSQFGYFALELDAIRTRKVGVDLPDALRALNGVTAVLHASYVPASAVPDEIADDAVAILAAMARGDR